MSVRTKAVALAFLLTISFHAESESSKEPRRVLNGIDVFVRENFSRLKGMKVGLITNHTGHDSHRDSTISLLKNASGVELKVLFSPEHGIDGTMDESVGNAVHQETGLPIISLYGASPKRLPNQSDPDYDMAVLQSRQPRQQDLKNLDALIYDIQDGGARFYTRIAILGGAIEAAGKAGIKIFVLDRVNPIGGAKFEGPVQTRHFSFVGYHNYPVRHGMTAGELARMFNVERDFNADLIVVPVENWQRSRWFDETGLPWTRLSPGLRNLNAATLYPGLCLLEATSVSLGRGTDKSFEVVGAPYIDDVKFASELNSAGLPGVRFVPIRFTPDMNLYVGPPTDLPFRGQECGGVHVILIDRSECHIVDIGIVIAQVLQRLYPEQFHVEKMAKLLGHDETLNAIKNGKSLKETKALWSKDLEQFAKRRERFLLYR
jgi:uncharacterized protein YbbC (DUF1343 family)